MNAMTPETLEARLKATRQTTVARTGLGLSMRLEFTASLRSRWFHFCSVVVIALMLLLITTGISESRVLGFTGLSRLLVTYIQIAMAVLPLFIIVTTLGLGFLISALSRSTEVALGASLLIWLALVALLDLLLLSVLIQERFVPDFVIAIALANPLQSVRTASMILFDPQLILLEPSSYVILDHFGTTAYVGWAMAYPVVLGLVLAAPGYWRFSRGDLV